MPIAKFVACLLAGVLLTPVAVFLAILSGGGGHGHYEFARLFFPYTMLLTRVTGDIITTPLMGLALFQFPVYGAAIGYAAVHRRALWTFVSIAVVHAIAAGFCFSGLVPNFS
jgi:hypothetical protein